MSEADWLNSFSFLSGGVLDAHGPSAAGNGKILVNSLMIMLVIVIPTILTTLVVGWWFRADNKKAKYLPTWSHSGHLELIVWGIPLLVVLFLSGVIWIGSHELDPSKPFPGGEKQIEVQVISLDWKWVFIYPTEGIASINDVVIPANSSLHFSLTSGTVMNMFFVPQLGSMIATMNGMVTELNLKANSLGDYLGQSTQFSGEGFSDMQFVVHAVSSEDYHKWINKAHMSKARLDKENYILLAWTKSNSPAFIYGQVDNNLFDNVVMRNLLVEANK